MAGAPNILLVDSDPDDVRTVREVVESAGLDLHVTSDRSAAIEVIDAIQPGLVLLQDSGQDVEDFARQLRAAAGSAAMPVVVSGDGAAGVRATLRAGIRVSGSVTFDGIGRPNNATMETLRLQFWPLDTFNLLGGARVEADGSFAAHGLVPGAYWLVLDSDRRGLHVKSVAVRGADVSGLPIVVGDEPVTNVEIAIADEADYAAVTGTVRSIVRTPGRMNRSSAEPTPDVGRAGNDCPGGTGSTATRLTLAAM